MDQNFKLQQRINLKAMSNYPTIIKQVAQALAELDLENGRTYKSNTVWNGVRQVLGLSVNDEEWKRLQGNLKRQLVDIGAIERVPGKYQMKIIDVEAIAVFTREYKPHRNPRQKMQGVAGQSKSEAIRKMSESLDGGVEEILCEENPLEGLKESVIIKLLSDGVITLSDILVEED
jgi:hypothetical protein